MEWQYRQSRPSWPAWRAWLRLFPREDIARAFDNQTIVLNGKENSAGNFLFGDGDDFVNKFLDNRQRNRSRMFDGDSVGEAGGVPSGTESYYSFDYANIHFICLDSQDSD